MIMNFITHHIFLLSRNELLHHRINLPSYLLPLLFIHVGNVFVAWSQNFKGYFKW